MSEPEVSDDSLDEELEDELEEGSEDDEQLDEDTNLMHILAQLTGRVGARREPQLSIPRLKDYVLPLQNEVVAQELLQAASGVNKRQRCPPGLDCGLDPSNRQLRCQGPHLQSQPHALESDEPVRTTSLMRLPSTGHFSSIDSLALEPASTSDTAIDSSQHANSISSPSQRMSCDLQQGQDTTQSTPQQDTAQPLSSKVKGVRRRRSSRVVDSEDEAMLDAMSQGDATASRRQSTEQRDTLSGSAAGRFLSTIVNSLSRRRSGASGDSGGGSGSRDTSAARDNGARGSVGGTSSAAHTVSRREEVPWSGAINVSTPRLLVKRELGLGDRSRFTRSQQTYLSIQPQALPTKPIARIEQHNARCYIGQFSKDGAYYIVGCQDHRVRVYEVRSDGPWRLAKDVRPRNVRWTITDTCVSPDQRYLIYCSIHPTVHLVNLTTNTGNVESLANVTEVHEDLELDDSNAERFGIWSVRWSRTGHEIIAGTNNESVYVYDMGEGKVVARGQGHTDDVNAVEYLDESPNHILTGSDDNNIKLWDRRLMDSNSRTRRAVGVFVGHTEGLTHLNSKGDGNCFISNCKDQTIKMWDVRTGLRSENAAAQLRGRVPSFSWDYRWMDYPCTGYDVRHPHDASVMTYRGHTVHHTLIRAYFSPAATTGQRLIYSGSADDKVHIWDALTGYEVGTLQGHSQLIRDVSWHPTEPLIVSVSWDGDVLAFGPSEEDACRGAQSLVRATRRTRLARWY